MSEMAKHALQSAKRYAPRMEKWQKTPQRGNKQSAQGIALGMNDEEIPALKGQTHLLIKGFCPFRAEFLPPLYPGCCPGLTACCPFGACFSD